jgi:hypothetical protein
MNYVPNENIGTRLTNCRSPKKVFKALGDFILAPSGKTFSYGTPEG